MSVKKLQPGKKPIRIRPPKKEPIRISGAVNVKAVVSSKERIKRKIELIMEDHQGFWLANFRVDLNSGFWLNSQQY